MDEFFLTELYKKNQSCASCPSEAQVSSFLHGLLAMLFPNFDKRSFGSFEDFQAFSRSLRVELLALVKGSGLTANEKAETAVAEFFNVLPSVSEKLQQDVEAMFQGDPAAKSQIEIIRTYPGFYAIAAYRIAHQLTVLGIPLLPRTIAELAHTRTGIDIHPGATIGLHFCIDHGTGVVIGETTTIGNNVKIYQGVTLGGLSVDKADALKKRHPTIEDDVVIYAGATILGGETVIGRNSVIGGNVWLTRSVPPGTKVYYKAALTNNDGETDIIEFKS